MSKTSQNQSKTIFDISCVLEALPWRFWNDFGLPNSLPKEVLEASSRLSKTSSLQLGLPGGLQNGFWTPFGPLGAGFWTIFGNSLSLKVQSDVCLLLLLCIAFRRTPNALKFSILVSIRDIFLASLGIPDQRVDYSSFPLPLPMCHEPSYQPCA